MSEYTEAQVEAGARALAARALSGPRAFDKYAASSQDTFRVQARAVLEAAHNMDRRAPVQGHGVSARNSEVTGQYYMPYGTITWEEHVEAWEDYNKRYSNHQTADIIAQRGGFSYRELIDHLGHEPKTWRPNNASV